MGGRARALLRLLKRPDVRIQLKTPKRSSAHRIGRPRRGLWPHCPTAVECPRHIRTSEESGSGVRSCSERLVTEGDLQVLRRPIHLTRDGAQVSVTAAGLTSRPRPPAHDFADDIDHNCPARDVAASDVQRPSNAAERGRRLGKSILLLQEATTGSWLRSRADERPEAHAAPCGRHAARPAPRRTLLRTPP
jgi:hypothetical protein